MMYALRVLHICCDTAYGCLAAVSELAAAQTGLGLAVDVALMREQGRPLSSFRIQRMKEAGVRVHVIDLPKLRRWMRPRVLARGVGIPRVVSATICRAGATDLVHGHGSLGAAYAYWTGRRLGVPVVGTQHGLEPGALRPLAWRWLSRRLTGSNSLVAPTGSREVPELGNGIDAPMWRSMALDGIDLRGSMGVASEDLLVGLIGRLVPEKQQVSILNVLTGHIAGEHGVHVAVVGDGPDLVELEKLAATTIWRDRLHLLGYVDDMSSVYRALDLLVVASSRESESMVILEAMASGVPVVATAVGGTPKLLAEGSGHVVVPPHDFEAVALAVHSLLVDPARRAEIAAKARLRAEERFSASRMAGTYLRQLYHPALG